MKDVVITSGIQKQIHQFDKEVRQNSELDIFVGKLSLRIENWYMICRRLVNIFGIIFGVDRLTIS